MDVRNPFSGGIVGSVAAADAQRMNQAIAAARGAYARSRERSRYERRAILHGIAGELNRNRAALTDLMIAESGKPRLYANAEVDRAVMTFTLAAEELSRWSGETVPIDLTAATAGYSALVERFPIGVVGAIAPFNFPLNLVAHKLAPAIAVGNTVVLKPPPQAPLTAIELAKIAYAAGLPADELHVLHCEIDVAQILASDERIAMLSFTGSARVGWHLKSIAGKKRVALELGGNAAAIVCADADLDWAARRCALGSFAQAGQVCIKVQRVLVEDSVYDAFLERYLHASEQLPAGDPALPDTVIGPVIDDASAARIMQWVEDATREGARMLLGGGRSGNVIDPIVLTQTQPSMNVECEEIFGPVSTVSRVSGLDDALERANATRYGLQAGIFTNDVRAIRRAFAQLDVGGLIVNDYPTLRVDNYPYGGMKDSGFGREGVRYAMEEMTHPRALVVKYA